MTVKFDFRQIVSISDLQRKQGEISEKVSELDLLVLKNNKPEFIIIAPQKYEDLMEAFDLIEQFDIYETIQKRRKKPSLSGKQMIQKLGTFKKAERTHDK